MSPKQTAQQAQAQAQAQSKASNPMMGSDASRIQSTQAKTSGDMGPGGFAARAQAGDKNDQAEAKGDAQAKESQAKDEGQVKDEGHVKK
ncbi:hypothetical protein CspHIS471_0302750 [Cutaneotrichosporon sp. HIS471]|nr:hypothetical protein CspHIS471_0302750 [Cutaneotrichosporon sp. HIS471]